MPQVLTPYSGGAVNVTFQNLGLGFPPVIAGGIASNGISKVEVRMTTDNSGVTYGIDGSAAPFVKPGYGGEIEIEILQTSTLQAEFLALWNLQEAAQLLEDVSNWFGSQVLVVATSTGSSHKATGCALKKVPPKTYGDEVAKISWIFVASNIIHAGG